MALFDLKALPTSVKKANEIESLIRRRRRQILVHSYIYYQLGDNLIDDATFDTWGRELQQLQRKYPEEASRVEFHAEFKNYTDSDTPSGFDLPYTMPDIRRKAEQLLAIRQKEEKTK